MEKLRLPLVLLVLGWALAAYAPGVGTGFVKDDFAWIRHSTVGSLPQAVSLFSQNTGFYRPVVSVSFAIDRAVFGLAPLGYGWTNALLVFLTAVAIARLARTLGLPPVAGVCAAGLWTLNPHGINMALLWTSGRTSLLLTLFAVLAADAVLRGRPWEVALFSLLAMLSKEEAVALPVILMTWSALRSGSEPPGTARARRLAGCALATLVPLAAYLALRWHSGAFTPSSAPEFYRLSLDPQRFAANALQYLDRAATFSAAACLLALLAVRRVPRLQPWHRRVAAMGAVWLAGGYALTVWLPVRSSLYAAFPSVGVALVAAMWLWLVAGMAGRVAVARTIVAVAVVAVVAVPIYWKRNDRWLAPARLSASLLPQLGTIAAARSPGTAIVIRDRDHPRESVAAAFGTLLPDAVALVTGRDDVRLWLEPPPAGWQLAGWQPPGPGVPAVRFVLRGLRLEPEEAPADWQASGDAGRNDRREPRDHAGS